jgi:hypothetical protein
MTALRVAARLLVHYYKIDSHLHDSANVRLSQRFVSLSRLIIISEWRHDHSNTRLMIKTIESDLKQSTFDSKLCRFTFLSHCQNTMTSF